MDINSLQMPSKSDQMDLPQPSNPVVIRTFLKKSKIISKAMMPHSTSQLLAPKSHCHQKPSMMENWISMWNLLVLRHVARNPSWRKSWFQSSSLSCLKPWLWFHSHLAFSVWRHGMHFNYHSSHSSSHSP